LVGDTGVALVSSSLTQYTFVFLELPLSGNNGNAETVEVSTLTRGLECASVISVEAGTSVLEALEV